MSSAAFRRSMACMPRFYACHSVDRDAMGWRGKPRVWGCGSGEDGHAKGASRAQPCMESGSADGMIRWVGGLKGS
jgi:hypothetical protein